MVDGGVEPPNCGRGVFLPSGGLGPDPSGGLGPDPSGGLGPDSNDRGVVNFPR
jgi:hypothetical protein